MKIMKAKYPKGSFKGQQTDGKFIDGYLYDNLKIMADKIQNDMTFMGVIYSSTLEVGTGKSVFASQVGQAWSHIMKKEHGIDVPFDIKNIVWNAKDLIDRSLELPKYSCIILDEWEDAHYWSSLGTTLRTFFRKCRQRNLFMLCIIPNWFQLPLGYAVSRSAFAIDVRFETNFERGHFSFYNFEAKKILYIHGKRTYHYGVVKPTFTGRFTDGYGVDKAEYLKAKAEDLLRWEKEEPKKTDKFDLRLKAYYKCRNEFPKVSGKKWAELFGVAPDTVYIWNNKDIPENITAGPHYAQHNIKHNVKSDLSREREGGGDDGEK